MSHSPEPWEIPIDEEGWLCINCEGGTVLGLPHWIQNSMDATMLSLEDAKRIVACVNACKGIPTKVLDRASFKPILDSLEHPSNIDCDYCSVSRAVKESVNQ
jgi:hypothetical protein